MRYCRWRLGKVSEKETVKGEDKSIEITSAFFQTDLNIKYSSIRMTIESQQ